MISSKTKEWICNFSMNGKAICATFSSDSKYFYTSGKEGNVYVWDIGERRCINRFIDYGSIRTTAIGISPNGKYLSTGSSSGVVNIYDMDSITNSNPTPVKELLNLTTEISKIGFNHDTQLLVFSSTEKRNALRFVHLPTFQVYSNFPKEKTPLSRVTAFDFAPDSSKITIGNNKGRALLFKLHHYHSRSIMTNIQVTHSNQR